MDNLTSAKLLLSLLDLTSLNDNDNNDSISEFCSLAATPYGKPAALCIYQQFIPVVSPRINEAIKIATVINFPQGENNINILEKEISSAIKLGADELDVVMPYKDFLAGNIQECMEYLTTARKLCSKKTLKIIIESGELGNISNIKQASAMCIEAKADFIKTSTGKTPHSATPEAANAILEVIKSSKADVGFKASGGIRTFLDAKCYLTLAQSIMGASWVNPQHLRIGASSLLKDLIKTIEQGY